MSQVTTDQIQSPAWEPIYAQQLIMPRDLMEINIFKPNDQSVKDQATSRIGLIEQKELKYFSSKNEAQESLKKRYPFFY